jgi:hypothetical protein
LIPIRAKERAVEQQQPSEQDQEDRTDESREQPEPGSLALE